jgi:uncharacterized UBP type Zn finger protein
MYASLIDEKEDVYCFVCNQFSSLKRNLSGILINRMMTYNYGINLRCAKIELILQRLQLNYCSPKKTNSDRVFIFRSALAGISDGFK